MAAAIAVARFHCSRSQPKLILEDVGMEATAVTVGSPPRAENIPAGYSPGWHAARTLILALSICAVGVYLARAAGLTDWLFVPLFMVAFNTIEWTVHRGPMHHPRPPRLLYTN